MRSVLKIKDEYLAHGITNTFLAEKAGITPAELFELHKEDVSTRKTIYRRFVGILYDEEKSYS